MLYLLTAPVRRPESPYGQMQKTWAFGIEHCRWWKLQGIWNQRQVKAVHPKWITKYIQLHSSVCLFWKGFYKYFGELRHFDTQLHTWATHLRLWMGLQCIGLFITPQYSRELWQLPLEEQFIILPSVLSLKGSSLAPDQQPSEEHRVSFSTFHRKGNWKTKRALSEYMQLIHKTALGIPTLTHWMCSSHCSEKLLAWWEIADSPFLWSTWWKPISVPIQEHEPFCIALGFSILSHI